MKLHLTLVYVLFFKYPADGHVLGTLEVRPKLGSQVVEEYAEQVLL